MQYARMPRTSRFRKPIYLQSATRCGSKYSVSIGDIVMLRDYRFARVFGMATHDGMGEPLKKHQYLTCLVLSENARFCYWRIVSVLDVVGCREPDNGAFIRWFFSAKMENVKAIAGADRNGSLSADYLDRYLDDDGELKDNWEEIFFKRTEG